MEGSVCVLFFDVYECVGGWVRNGIDWRERETEKETVLDAKCLQASEL